MKRRPITPRRGSRWPQLGYQDVLIIAIGAVVGVDVNLLTAHPESWPAALQPIAEHPMAANVGTFAALGAYVGWRQWRLRPQPVTWTGDDPYPALEPFTEQFAATFFGRGADVRELLRQVDNARSGPAVDRSICVIGRSGSGKSSLVQAGLLPVLRQKMGMSVVGPFTPGTDPLRSLAGALAATTAAYDAEEVLRVLRADLEALGDGTGKPAGLVALLEEIGRRPVLVVDQLEEAASQAPAEQRDPFLGLLRAALRHSRRLLVISTLRSDHLGHFQTGVGTELVGNVYLLNDMGGAELRQVIEGPAGKTGVTFDSGLVEEILDACGSSDVLPMLSLLLQGLYARIREEKRTHITHGDYAAVGPLAEVIEEEAHKALESLVDGARDEGERDARREFVLSTLLMFVTVDEESVGRRPVPRADLTAEQSAVADRFIKCRLLTSRGGRDEPPVVTLAHEALLRNWESLRERVKKYKDLLRRRGHLERLAHAWADADRGADYLLRGRQLEEARGWLAEVPAEQRGAMVPDLVAEFLEASGAGYQDHLAGSADVAARAALARLPHDPEAAIQLAEAAVSELTPSPPARRALYEALGSGLRAVIPNMGDDCPPAFSPDGRLAVADTYRNSRGVCVWNSDGSLSAFLPHPARVIRMAWAPDGRLATATEANRPDGHSPTVYVWDPPVGGAGFARIEPRHVLEHGDWISFLAWSPGGHLATVSGPWSDLSRGSVLRLWPRDLGARQDPLPVCTIEPDPPITAIAWSPECLIAAAVGHELLQDQAYVRMWSADGEPRYSFPCGNEPARALSFSDDGRLAVGGRRKVSPGDPPHATVDVWTAQDGLRPLDVHPSAEERLAYFDIARVVWSRDGALAAIADEDTHVYLWSRDGRPHRPLIHEKAVTSLAWSLDGCLATATGAHRPGDADRFTTCLWTEDGRKLHTFHDTLPALSVAWSPAAELAVTRVPGIRIWSTGDALRRDIDLDLGIEARHNDRGRLAWSPDGVLAVATGHPIGEDAPPAGVRLFSRRGRLLRTLPYDDVRWLAWSPRGELAVSGTVEVGRMNSEERAEIVEQLTEIGDWARLEGHNPSRITKVDVWGIDDERPRTLRCGDGLGWLSWCPDGDRLAVRDLGVSPPELSVLRAADGEALFTLREADTSAVSWSPSASLLTIAGWRRTARLWPDRAGEPLVLRDGVNDADWSADNRLATGEVTADDNGRVSIWPADGGQPEHVDTEAGVTMVRWAPDGTLAAREGDETPLPILLIRDGRRIASLDHGDRRVSHLVWSPDSRLATVAPHGATGSIVRVWSATGELLLDVDFPGKVRHMLWTPGGGLTVWTGDTLTLLPDPVPWPALAEAARQRNLRPLTDEERRAAFVPVPGRTLL
ncbi:AAA family ATPase [Microbispora sp. NPDC046973]|uniref:AAA family ATPase n=1 Tax=Microbispora sp. NPDC046973 TaxID=3155022 RepID=UPI0033C62830